jgi:hypothetical protein
MDIEKRRISTRFALPFVPIMGDTVSLMVRYPKTGQPADGRKTASVAGWALSELGISDEILAGTEDPVEAMKEADLSGGSELQEVERLNDQKKLQRAFKALRDAIPSLTAFSSEARAKLEVKVNAVLTQYQETDNPASSRF